MLSWKNICGVLPSILPSRLLLLRQSSAISVAFMKSELGEHGIFRANPPKVCLVECRSSFGQALRFLSEKASRDQKENSVLQDLVEAREQEQTQLTVASKVAQAGKDVSYFGIILVGFAITGALLWFVISELFFGFSANRVYASALKKVKASAEVVEAIGEPIMGHGETTSRGRRRHVSYQEYLVDGENYMRVKFYLSGSKRKGTVHVDVKQGSRGNFDYRFIFVELSPYETIVVLDNR